MQGYQLTFFTQQDRKHGRLPLAEGCCRKLASSALPVQR
jgi:hypothetical protein